MDKNSSISSKKGDFKKPSINPMNGDTIQALPLMDDFQVQNPTSLQVICDLID